jgi:prepilin-type N-terminal cleavage/methylation domain-containing protein
MKNPPSPTFPFVPANSSEYGKGGGGIMGFTLLEVLVATSILGIAVAVVLQLFSANLRALSLSGDYVSAAMRAESKMGEILNDDALSEKISTETTDDGYRIEISVTETLKERTENLQVKLLAIDLTIQWMHGAKERSLTLRTVKVVNKGEILP